MSWTIQAVTKSEPGLCFNRTSQVYRLYFNYRLKVRPDQTGRCVVSGILQGKFSILFFTGLLYAELNSPARHIYIQNPDPDGLVEPDHLMRIAYITVGQL
jgi:hypothetical protein